MTMPRMPRHPKGVCKQAKCRWCYPKPGKARVHAEVVLTLDMVAIAKELGIKDHQLKDAKRWVLEDIETLVGRLPYANHMSDFNITVHGIGEPT